MKFVKPQIGFLILLGLSLIFPLRAELSLDSERLDLEMRMQKRVEDALGKILPAGQFVVVIRIEPLNLDSGSSDSGDRGGEEFFLPGVPAKKSFDGAQEEMRDLVDTLKPENKIFKKFIRRIQVTLVLDKDLDNDIISKVRELTRQLISLDPGRGDTLDIQRTVFTNNIETQINPTGILKIQKDLKNYWLLVVLVLALFCIAVFFLFMFGPLRGFLNNFVQILPTLKPPDNGRGRMSMDMPYMPPYMSPYGLPPPAQQNSSAAFSGSLQVENPNKTILPFGFIREDHLSNLAILLARETPEKAAVVLGYLPSEWISKVLSKLDPLMQSEVASHLATTRQLLPEQVEDIEQDLRRRLDYLIGGPDRIFSIYESLEVEAQKRMLESLKESRPEIVEELRKKTLMFEDLERLESPSLRAVLREVDLQTIVTSLRGVSESLKKKILEHMSEGKAEIVRQELDLNEGVLAGKATWDAQKKVVLIAKRLEREGQINVPHIESTPSTRFGNTLRQTIKLPPGIQFEDAIPGEQISRYENKSVGNDIGDRIKRFLGKGGGNNTPDRYPTTPSEPPVGGDK